MIGGLAAVHQFCRIGTMAIIGGCSKVVQDVPPYMMADGNPGPDAAPFNKVGLERNGVSEEAQAALKQAYRILFRAGLTQANALSKIESDVPPLPECGICLSLSAPASAASPSNKKTQTGSVISMEVPLPGTERMRTLPRCVSMTRPTMASPSPVPFSFVVLNREEKGWRRLLFRHPLAGVAKLNQDVRRLAPARAARLHGPRRKGQRAACRASPRPR